MSASARHRLEYGAFRLLRGAAALLPEPLARKLGALLGLFVGSALRMRRADVDRHLGIAFADRPAAWRRRVARASYAHFGREAVVFLQSVGWPPERILERTRVEGFDALHEATERGAGVVLLTGHLGNWEMGGAAIAARGVPLDVVGKGMSNALFQEDLFAARERLGMRVIEMGRAGSRVLRSLADGRVVALLSDQSAHRGGVSVPFFGRAASTARGPALLALRSGAPVFVGFAVRDRDSSGRYTASVEHLAFSPTGELERDVQGLLSAYADALEDAVRAAPEQYFWQHRRWKRQPAEEPRSEA